MRHVDQTTYTTVVEFTNGHVARYKHAAPDDAAEDARHHMGMDGVAMVVAYAFRAPYRRVICKYLAA